MKKNVFILLILFIFINCFATENVLVSTFSKGPMDGYSWRQRQINYDITDTNGFWIAQKVFEKGQWLWPDTAEDAKEIKIDEVIMLLKGIDFFCAYGPVVFESID